MHRRNAGAVVVLMSAIVVLCLGQGRVCAQDFDLTVVSSSFPEAAGTSVSGTATTTITNQGLDDLVVGFTLVVFGDVDANQLFDAGIDTFFGSAPIAELDAGEIRDVLISLSGELAFSGALLSVVIDSDNAVAETDETNNYFRQVRSCGCSILDLTSELLLVDFEGFAESTEISDQYASLGVNFSIDGDPLSFPIVAVEGGPTVAFTGAGADAPMSSGAAGLTAPGGQYLAADIRMDFTSPVNRVRFFLIDIDTTDVFQVNAYRGSEIVETIDIASGDPGTGNAFSTEVSLTMDLIDSIVVDFVSSTGPGFALDFLTFERPCSGSCGTAYYVAQESAPGVGDFDRNTLGFVVTYPSVTSATDFYAYGVPEGQSWNGASLTVVADRSHLLFAETTEGLTLFMVHDRAVPDDPDGGRAETVVEIVGDPDGAFRSVQDDPDKVGAYTGSPGDSVFTAQQTWLVCCTDGQAISGIDPSAEVLVSFQNLPALGPAIAGLDEWVVYSSDGSTIPVTLAPGRRVRLQPVGLEACPDLTASRVSFSCGTAGPAASVRIGNGGETIAFAPIPVSFYGGDPAAGAPLLGIVETTIPISANSFEDLTLPLPIDYDCSQEITVVVDDAGGLVGVVPECDENNNTATGVAEINTFTDYTLQLSAEFQQTTFSQATSVLLMDVRVCNDGSGLVDYPIRMVIEGFTEPEVAAQVPDGLTVGGQPYFEIAAPEGGASFLKAGACSEWRRIGFFNPNEVPVLFDYSLIAPDNQAPFFTSVPATLLEVGDPFTYDANAIDPNGHTITFSLLVGPVDMTVDPMTGVVMWPLPAAGSTAVTVRASDDRGATTDQSFTLEAAVAVNRPPFFVGAPAGQASVGAAYSSLAVALDPDGDPVTITLENDPGVPDPSTPITVSPSGLIEWGFTLAGSYLIRVRATDDQGAYAEQGYVLTVGNSSTNPSAPTLTGAPATLAVVGVPYVYQPVGQDSDPGDSLTYSLEPGAPAGVTVNPVSGQFEWTPTAGDLGPNPVAMAVTDEAGALATQGWTIEVVTTAANLPPVITSPPNFSAVEGVPYSYSVQAVDPEMELLSYELVDPGMPTIPPGSIDPATGEITWGVPTIGSFPVAVRVSDPEGAFGSQVFTLTVVPPNNSPVLTPIANSSVFVGGSLQLAVEAVDADGHALTYVLPTAPDGMQIHPSLGFIGWTPTVDQSSATVGPHDVTVRAFDPYGGFDEASFQVTVLDDTVSPEVSILAERQLSPPDPVRFVITVFASDDVRVAARTLTIDGAPVSLDTQGQTVFFLPGFGTYSLEATATDVQGNVTTVNEDLDFQQDPNRPVVELDFPPSPAPESTITCPVDLVGSIFDLDGADPPQPVQVASWTVTLTSDSSGEVRQIASGTGNVDHAPIATVDPTLLPNGSYRIGILAQDGNGNTGGVEFRVQIAGELKLGEFTTTSTDLVIPLGGIPIVINRHYSSLDASPGDFGPGWRIGLPGEVDDDAQELDHPDPLVDSLNDEAFQFGTKVYVTLPTGRRVGFRFTPTATTAPFVWRPAFTPDPGVDAQLVGVPRFGGAALFSTGTGFFEFIYAYNPETYLLTTADGLVYTIDETNGLQLIEDANGNTITVTPDGLFHSLGTSVAFVRDKSGNIVSITEPDTGKGTPGQLTYTYDSMTGNLVAFGDAMSNVTEYFYEEAAYPHHLTRVEDPLDRPLIRNVYDAEGRLSAQCPSSGDLGTLDGCVTIDTSLAALTQTIFDGNGHRTDLFFDVRGNITKEREWIDGTTFYDTDRTYDESGREILVVDAEGNSTAYTYDESGNRLTRTNSLGDTWTYTYNSCRKITSLCDPLGNLTTLVYDSNCNLTQVTDPLGNTIHQTFDAQGQRTSYVDARGNVWLYTYDPQGRPDSVTSPWGAVMTFQINAVGEVTELTWFDGKQKTFEYDDLHRVTSETWNTVPPTVVQYAYDVSGRLISAVSPEVTVTATFWPSGRERDLTTSDPYGSTTVSYGVPRGSVLSEGYDGNGNVTHVSDSLGGTTEYTYDPLDRLSGMFQYPSPPATSGVLEKRVDVSYAGSGLPSALSRFSDLAGSSAVATTQYGYDCGSCSQTLNSLLHVRDADGAVLHQIDLTRDELGMVTEMNDAEGAHTFVHDGLQRLLSASHPIGGPQVAETFGYDESGNRTSSHLSSLHVIDPLSDRLLEDDSFTYAYDLNGDLIARTDKVTLGVLEFEYDHTRRPIRIAESDSSGTLIHESQWIWDAIGRRVAVIENGAVRRFIHDGDNPIVVVDDNDVVLHRRLYGRGIDEVIADESPAGTHWFLTDHLGSVRDVIDNAGTIVNHYVYDSFGLVVDQLNPGFENELQFTSREQDPLFEFSFYRRRMYAPAMGRFLQPDPKYPFRYDYASNNPITFRDPTGELTAAEYTLIGSLVSLVLFFCNPLNAIVSETGNPCALPTGVDILYDTLNEVSEALNEVLDRGP